jgi:hypothetical protein
MSWLRDRMPLDGFGWQRSADRQALARAAARPLRRRLPAPVAGLGLAGARAGWLPLALLEAWSYSGQPGHRTPLAPLFLDCLMAGAQPGEAWQWRALYGDRIELGKRAASLLLSVLGAPAGHALLTDKVAAAEVLRAAGAPAPETLVIIGPQSAEAELEPVRRARVALAIKPRSGYGARGLIFAEPLGEDRWRVNGAEEGWEALSGRLRGAGEPLVAQPRLRGAAALEGFLDAERPPILRVTTARRPGAPPFLHGALLSIPIPGNAATRVATKDLRAPVDLATGRLGAAVLLAEPGARLASIPWNGARIEGRGLEGFAAAAAATLTAAAAVPPLPVISWDVVLTEAGPVILEGNSMANWLLANFSRLCGGGAGSLLPLLAEWVEAVA